VLLRAAHERRRGSSTEADAAVGRVAASRNRVEALGDGWGTLRLGCDDAPLGRRVVENPALTSVCRPVGRELFDGLLQVIGDAVDVGPVARSAHGDVGEFTPTAVGDDMGSVDGGALGSVDGGGIRVVDALRRIDRHEAAVGST